MISHNEFQSSEPIEPQEASPKKHEMNVLGIDIAKRVFHAVGMDDRGNVVYRKRVQRQLQRNELARFYHHRTRKCIPPRKLRREIQ